MPKREQEDLFSAPPLPVAALDDSQRIACLRLIRSENVGPATFRALINHYGGASRALEALPEIGRRAGRGRPIRICSAVQAEAELDGVRRAGAQIVFTIEPGYPAPLAFLEGAPPMLYVKGNVGLLSREIIAIVGSRQSSAAGQQLARQLAGGFGSAGFVVASGLARGIDGAAHQATLETGTIAVLAGGVDVIYPPEHKALHAEIGERGCLVAEQPMGFQPRAQDFPRRNRIISGIARAVVIVEAARRSGSLITARLAGEQGREVFAVPGHPLDPRAEGTNQLIKDGATVVTCAEDVLRVLGEPSRVRVKPPSSGRPSGLTEPEHHEAGPPPLPVPESLAVDAITGIEAVLGPAPVAIDELGRSTGMPARVVQAALLELALAGRIEWHGSHLVSLRGG